MWTLIALAAAQTFTPPADAEWTAGRTLHDAADLTGDGVADLVWVSSGTLTWAAGRAGGLPEPDAQEMPSPDELLGLGLAADLDGDGFADVITRQLDGRWVGWPGGAEGPTAPVWSLGDAGEIATHLGDVNGDGAADLALDTTAWLSSPAGPIEGPTLPTAERSQLHRAGDVNGDGYADIAGPDAESEGWYGGRIGPLRLYLGGPDGPDTTPLWSYTGVGETGMALTPADVDGDGVDELVVACISVADESGVGELVVLDDLANPDGPTLRSTTPLDLDLGEGLALAARDGDGADDVLAAWEGGIRVLPWTADDGFTLDSPTADRWTGDRGVVSLTTTDISADGTADVVAAWARSGGGSTFLTAWLGDADIVTDPTDTAADTEPAADPAGDTAIAPKSSGGCGCDSGAPGALGPWLAARALLRRRAASPSL
ncbi:MAG: hypothetical protein ACI8PZ_004179 [Myxococcota bacterium]|jgi:hypothetical protein